MDSKYLIHMQNPTSADKTEWNFGQILRKYRNAAKLKQSDLAEMLSTSRNAVVNWENNIHEPNISTIKELVSILGIPLYELFGIEDSTVPSAQETIQLREYRQLSPVNKIVAAQMVHTMLEQETLAREQVLKNKYFILPLESTPAAAGIGCPDNENPPTPFFVSKTRKSQTADAIVRVSGDSMEPKYFDGDYVYVKYTQDADDGDDVICVYHEGFIIKNMRNNKLYSLNKKRDFGDRHENDDIRLIGKVIGIVEDGDIPEKEDTAALQELFVRELREFDKAHGVE